MFEVDETGPEIKGNNIRFRICFPDVEKDKNITAIIDSW